jgi:CBS domain-containing protein
MANTLTFPMSVVAVTEEATLADVAKLMRDKRVGCVFIVEKRGLHSVPVGVITDRDLVVRAGADGMNFNEVKVKVAMSKPVICGRFGQESMTLLELMRQNGVRRLAMLNYEGGLGGVVSLDDLWSHLGQQLGTVIGIVTHEQLREKLGIPAGQEHEFRRQLTAL